MRFFKYNLAIIALAILSSLLLTACDDNTSEVGSSLVTDESEVVIDSLFTLSGSSTPNEAILSRTTLQLLGSLKAEEYGAFEAGFVTQFMPAQNIDTVGVSVNDMDSVKMVLFIRPGGFTGDSIVPMGLTVYQLNRQLTTPINSDFDPTGYYDPQNIWASAMYSANALHNDSIANLSYRTVEIKLPKEFGKRIYTEYRDNQSIFNSPQAFAQFFPGVYVKSTFGSGRVMNIMDSRINFYYTRHAKITTNGVEKDTLYHFTRTYMAVTPEVITNNIIRYDMSAQLRNMIDAGESLLIAPAGSDVTMQFPTKEILDSYQSQGHGLSVLNTLSLSIPVEQIKNDYGIKPPANVLIILAKEKDTFFANGKLNDDKTSFMATYDEKTHTYGISNMRDYLLSLLNKEEITTDDCTFIITPVDVVTETTSNGYYGSQVYVTGINPYASKPTMAKLLLDKAKIKLIFSMQSINN